MKIILTEEQFKRVILKEQGITEKCFIITGKQPIDSDYI